MAKRIDCLAAVTHHWTDKGDAEQGRLRIRISYDSANFRTSELIASGERYKSMLECREQRFGQRESYDFHLGGGGYAVACS